MTIKRDATVVNGKKLEGFLITCCRCPMTSFLPSVKHLPAQVVTKKFQDRKWEVNKRGEDLCPKCLEKHHNRKKRRPRGSSGERVIPVLERLPLSVAHVQRVIGEAGIQGVTVIELESKTPKYRIILPNLSELSVPRLHHAEGRLVEVFDADFETNYLRPELTPTNGAAAVHVTVAFHWVVALRPRAHTAALAIAAE